MTHHRDICIEHGLLVAQCRCPSKDKPVHKVPCPASLKEKHEAEITEMHKSDAS